MRYFHKGTLSGLLVHLRWLARKSRHHVIRRRRVYVSAGMIHIALVVFVGDAVAAAVPIPHFILVVIHTQKAWAVPIAAAVGHIGFMLDSAAAKEESEAKLRRAEERLAALTRAHERMMA